MRRISFLLNLTRLGMLVLFHYFMFVLFKGETMRKRTLILGIFLLLMVVCCVSAFADGGSTSSGTGSGFFNSVGGFLYNALPWNWGNWWGK